MGSLGDQPEARLWLGNALLSEGRNADALTLLDDEVVTRVPGTLRPFAQLARGTALLDTGAPDRAEPCLVEAVLAPRGEYAALAHLLLTILRLNAGRRDEARASAESAWFMAGELDPVVRGRIALFRAVAWNDDETRLRQSVEEADRLLPADWPERPILAHVLRTADPERALKLLDSIPRPSADWILGMAGTRVDALAALERWDDAVAALSVFDGEGVRPKDRVAARCYRADLLLRAGRPEEAQEVLDGVEALALTMDEVADGFLEVQARVASERDDRDRLNSVYDRMAARTPRLQPLAQFARAESLLLAGDPVSAEETFRRLGEPADPHNAVAWAIAALARYYTDRPDAQEAEEQALALDPTVEDLPPLRSARAVAAARRGDAEGVDAAYGPLSTLPGHRTVYRSLRAWALREAGDNGAALAELDAAIDEARHTPSRETVMLGAQALAEKAMLLLGDGQIDAAEAASKEAEQAAASLAAPRLPTFLARLVRGFVLSARGAHQQADDMLVGARTSVLPHGDLLDFLVDFARGVNWLKAGPQAAEDALHYLSSAVRRKPDDPDTLHFLGEVQLTLEDPQAALDVLNRSLAGTGDLATAACVRRDLAAALRHLGRLEEAVAVGREAVAADPRDGRNWLSLGASHLELGRLEAAAVAFRRGWQLHPATSDRISTQLLLGLTKALVDAGDASAALAVLNDRRVHRLAAVEPLIELNRAVALWKLDRYNEAAEALDAAGRREDAAGLRQSRSARDSWVGFWFGPAASPARHACGWLLAVGAVLATVPILVDAERVHWLGWVAQGNVRPLVPLIIIGLLFLLPVTTRIKVGDVEIEQPASAAPILTELHAVSWDAVDRKLKRLATATLPASPAAALPDTGLDTKLRAAMTVSMLRAAALVTVPLVVIGRTPQLRAPAIHLSERRDVPDGSRRQ